MRLKDDGTHDLGTFTSFTVTEDEKDIPIIPESIEGEDIDINRDGRSTWEGFQTERISKKAKLALYSITTFIGLLVVIDICLSTYELWQIHWTLGAILGIFAIVMAILSGRAIHQWVKGKDGVEAVHELQEKAESVRNGPASYELRALIEQIQHYYQNTPLEATCTKVVEDLPDYLNDLERLEQFEKHFLEPIDRRAEKIIQRHSLQTGASVAFSPIPAIDAFLTLWRNAIMLNEIGSAYGVKPTLSNRIRLLIRVARTVAYSGLSQSAIDAIDVSNIPYVSIGAKALQGFGAGIATARVGHYCVIFCRPIRLKDDEGYFDKFLSALKIMLGKKIFTGSEGSTKA